MAKRDKAQRDRIRRSLVKCLEPIRAQEDSLLGCLLLLGAYPLAVLIVRLVFDTSLLASLGWGVAAWLLPLAGFGYYTDVSERRSRIRAYESFYMFYAPGTPRRALAISVLREMAQDSVNSNSTAASQLLTELGEDLPTAPDPESQLDDQLEEAVKPRSGDLPPIDWPASADSGPGADQSAPRQRYDHIPLEPEEPKAPHNGDDHR